MLMATGRVPNTDRIGADAAGFDVTDEGTLSLDSHLRVLSGGSPLEGVYALGDIANRYQLKHVANREARVVPTTSSIRRACGALTTPGCRSRSSAIPRLPPWGSPRRKHGRGPLKDTDIVVAVQEYGSTAYGWAMEDSEGIVKLIAEKSTGRLLGAHIVGHEASILVQPLVQAIALSTTVPTLARGPYWIHPALTEVVENALLALEVDSPADAPL